MRNTGLTRRQIDVLNLLTTPLEARDIAEHLGIAHRTVCDHSQRIYTVLHVSGRREAVEKAWELGLIELCPTCKRPAS